jgi:hypothetical protein
VFRSSSSDQRPDAQAVTNARRRRNPAAARPSASRPHVAGSGTTGATLAVPIVSPASVPPGNPHTPSSVVEAPAVSVSTKLLMSKQRQVPRRRAGDGDVPGELPGIGHQVVADEEILEGDGAADRERQPAACVLELEVVARCAVRSPAALAFCSAAIPYSGRRTRRRSTKVVGVFPSGGLHE